MSVVEDKTKKKKNNNEEYGAYGEEAVNGAPCSSPTTFFSA